MCLLSFGGFALSALAVVSLAIARPDLSISSDPISEYVHGPYSWVQIAVFMVVGLGSLALAAGVRMVQPPSPSPRLAGVMLGVWGAGMVVAGFIDLEDAVFSTDEGFVHRIVVEVAFLSVLGAMVLLNHLRLARGRRSVGTSQAWTVAAAAALVLTGVLYGGGWFGLAERVVAGAVVAWLGVVALRLPPSCVGEPTVEHAR